MTTVLDQFEQRKKRVAQDYGALRQRELDAIKRRQAAMGGGPGRGAAAKERTMLAMDIEGAKQKALEGVEAQEAQERQRLSEIKEAREFAKSERVASQEYQSGETQKQRGFITGERMGTQQFQAGENLLTRELQKGMARGMVDGQKTLQAKQFEESRSQFRKQFAQAQEQFNESIRQFNTSMEFKDRELAITAVDNYITQAINMMGEDPEDLLSPGTMAQVLDNLKKLGRTPTGVVGGTTRTQYASPKYGPGDITGLLQWG